LQFGQICFSIFLSITIFIFNLW